MEHANHSATNDEKKRLFSVETVLVVVVAGLFLLLAAAQFFHSTTVYHAQPLAADDELPPAETEPTPPPAPTLDRAEYDRRMLALANYPEPIVSTTTATTTATTTELVEPDHLWPVTDAPYPLPRAILPFQRIVAFYGNFYSTKMGVLGEYESETMLTMLKEQVAAWEEADPDTPVLPAIDYIAVTAQATAGPDGNYNLRMPDDQIDHALELAGAVDGIVILEVQVGQANLMAEIRLLEKYLKMPQVHLAIDPEFHMRRGYKPGEWVGTVTAGDVNAAIEYLSGLVEEYNVPPKVLVVHRFTQKMVQNAAGISPTAQVQVVMDMDGWGSPAKKKNTYSRVIEPEPVQFTGFKVFYKNDLKPPSTRLMLPDEILELRPRPIFIQYQ